MVVISNIGPSVGNVMKNLKPVFMMIVVQVAFAMTGILLKVISKDGMSLCVFIAYRTMTAPLFFVPFAFIMERKSIPEITPWILFQAFLCGLFGVTIQQNLFVAAIALANATYATSVFNLVPGVTFILALCFRLEMLNIGTLAGKAKVVGTLMGIGGAMILTFYKSIEIHIWSTHHHLNIGKYQHQQNVTNHGVPNTNTILGCVLALTCCVSYSLWLIIQAKMSEKFAWRYTSVALMTLMASIQSFIFALSMERDWNQWKLGWDIRLFSILFTGIATNAMACLLIQICVRLKGPLFASIFNPLFLILVAIGETLVLHEKLYLGSIIGSVLIVVGLYSVLWGKGKELKNITEKAKGEEALHEIISTNHDAESIDDKIGENIQSNNMEIEKSC